MKPSVSRIKAALEELSTRAESTDKTAFLPTLRTALAAKSNTIVAKAADLAGRFNAIELLPDLCAAFLRFADKRLPSDKFCLAKTEIVKAVHKMGSDQSAIFLIGMGCYWPSRPRAGQRDEAAVLRIASLLAHAELATPCDLEPLIDLLVDPVSDVRHAAVRAIVAAGGQIGRLLIRFKALMGDDNPSVMDECFAGLLERDGNRYLSFVATFMESEDERVRAGAAVAIGESRHEKALDALTARWQQTYDPDFKRDLLVAVSLLRSEPATQFLLSLISGSGSTSADALAALATYRSNPDIRAKVETAVVGTGSRQLRQLFESKFGCV